MAELHRESPLFDRLLPIQITDDVHDNRGTNLVLRILKGSQPTASAGQIESVLHIEVTDDNDPCFLFYMDVGESSFHILKRDQAILVEFKVFPVKLIELIELCLLNPTNSAALKSSKSQATGSSSFANALEEEISTAAERNMHNCLGDESFFNAKLNTVTGVFSVVESNKFKQLTHISLVLQAGDDTAIKRYLASRLTLTLDVAAKQTADISRLSVAQEQAHRAMEDMKEELNAMRTQRSVELQSINSSHSQELSQVQIHAMETIEQMRERYESQLSTLRHNLETVQSTLQQKSTDYDQQLADVTLEKNQLDFKLRDVSRQHQAVSSDRDRLLQECEQAAASNTQLENEKSSLQKEIVKLDAQIGSLLQQIQSKEENVEKCQALQRAAESAKESMEQRLQLYINNAEAMQSHLKEYGDEIERGNAAIEKLSTENRSLRDKIKLKSEVIRKQESLVNELRGRTNEVDADSRSVKHQLVEAQKELGDTKKQLQETQQRLSESNKVIASNQDVISYLNEEINKWQLGVRVNDEPIRYSSPSQRENKGDFMTSPFGVDARPSPEYVATPADLNGGKTEDPANTDLSKFDEQNVYFKGLQNLGLGSVLSEGLIDLHSLTPSTAITNNTVSYDNAVTRLRGKPVGYPSIITPPTGQKSDLESLDYYNIPSASNSGRKNSAGKPLPPPLPHQQYDWQSPTFGLEESTTRNLRSSRLQ